MVTRRFSLNSHRVGGVNFTHNLLDLFSVICVGGPTVGAVVFAVAVGPTVHLLASLCGGFIVDIARVPIAVFPVANQCDVF